MSGHEGETRGKRPDGSRAGRSAAPAAPATVRIGKPNLRNVGQQLLVWFALPAVFGAIWLLLNGSLLPVILVGIIMLVGWGSMLGMHTVTLEEGTLTSRRWWRCLLGQPGVAHRFERGQQIVFRPDCRFELDRNTLTLRLANWKELRRLLDGMLEFGLVVDDRRAAWERRHPLRWKVWTYGGWPFLIAFALVFVFYAMSTGQSQDAWAFVLLLAQIPFLALLVVSRPPRSIEPEGNPSAPRP
jgi:hypothetical protein